MNWLKKGPELKLPKLKMPSLKRSSSGGSGSGGSGLKPPAFLSDLYYDMRDRRLLPLIALVLVAIAAVPFLMGSDPEPLPPAGSGVAESPTANASKLTVVEATPGLRDYRKRLRGRSPSDPFVQQYAETAGGSSSSEGGASSAASSSSGGSPAGSTAAEVGGAGGDGGETAPGSSPGGGGSAGVAPEDNGQRFYAYRPNVRFGVAGSDQLALHEHLSLGSLLPQKNPVIVFIGTSEDGNRVAFNVSREVTTVRGPGRCVGGKEDCSLLILRAGQAVDLVTEAGQTFRLQVVGIDFIEVERPKPASSSSKAGKRRSAYARLVVGQFQNPPKRR